MTARNPLYADIKRGDAARLPEGFLLGHSEDVIAGTGCTAILCEEGAVAGVSVRGAAPASLETDLLAPQRTVQAINAVMLTGGSAFGLEAASGAMMWLSERRIGFAVGDVRVPIVCAASIYDLGVAESTVFPDKVMGYNACASRSSAIRRGNVGAGIGASVGKLLGERSAMKGGLGVASFSKGELTVTAVVVVNAVGNVIDRSEGKVLAGVRDPHDLFSIIDANSAFEIMAASGKDKSATLTGTNTTIGCILTNARITKAQATHIADMAHDGLARAIDPVHTGFDGDAIFALGSSKIEASYDYLGMVSAWVMEEAIHDAVLSVEAAYDLPSARSLTQ